MWHAKFLYECSLADMSVLNGIDQEQNLDIVHSPTMIRVAQLDTTI